CGEDAVLLGVHVDVGVVDAEDEVLDVALARCGEQRACNTLGLQVLAQALTVAPHTGVVDDDGVVDAVLGVVDLGRLVGVDDLDRGAVGPDDVVLLVDPNGAVEAAMDGVAAQQGGTLLQVVLGVLTDDDGTQARAGLLGALGEQNAGQEAADAAEAVEDDVGGRAVTAGADDVGELLLEELIDGGSVSEIATLVLECGGQGAKVRGDGVQVELCDALEDRHGVRDRQVVVDDATCEAVLLQNVGLSNVDELATEDGRHDVLFAAELPEQRDHLFRQGDALVPISLLLVDGRRSGHETSKNYRGKD